MRLCLNEDIFLRVIRRQLKLCVLFTEFLKAPTTGSIVIGTYVATFYITAIGRR